MAFLWRALLIHADCISLDAMGVAVMPQVNGEYEDDYWLLDAIIAPICLTLLVGYHLHLYYRYKRRPLTTVMGLNHRLRYFWVHDMMTSTVNGRDILAVQTGKCTKHWICTTKALSSA